MAQISKPPIPMSLYRHFALVTVSLTAMLAMFASGENEEYRQQASQPQPQASPSPAPSPDTTPRYGEAQMVQAAGGGSFGVEAGADNSYGNPTLTGGDLRFINSSNLPEANSENAGFTDAYLDSLSEEELAELLQAMREGGIEDSERRQASAIMEAASRRRSGQGRRVD